MRDSFNKTKGISGCVFDRARGERRGDRTTAALLPMSQLRADLHSSHPSRLPLFALKCVANAGTRSGSGSGLACGTTAPRLGSCSGGPLVGIAVGRCPTPAAAFISAERALIVLSPDHRRRALLRSTFSRVRQKPFPDPRDSHTGLRGPFYGCIRWRSRSTRSPN